MRSSTAGRDSPLSSSPSLNGSGSWSRVDVSTMRRTPSSISLVKPMTAPGGGSSISTSSSVSAISSSSSSSPSSPPRGSHSSPQPVVPSLALPDGGHASAAKQAGSPPAFVPASPSSLSMAMAASSSLRSSTSGTSSAADAHVAAASPHRMASPRHQQQHQHHHHQQPGFGASELARRALLSSADLVAAPELTSGARAGLSSSSNPSSLASSLSYSTSGLTDRMMALDGSSASGGWGEYHTLDALRIRKLAVDNLPRSAPLRSATRLLALLLKHQDRLFKVNQHDQVPEPLYALFEHLTNNGLAVEDLFAFQISRVKVEPLYHLVMYKGMSLSNETNIHLVSEILRLALERLPRRPFHFARFEPPRSFDELEGDEAGSVKLAEEVLGRVDAVERQIAGQVVGLVGHLVSMAEVNGANEELLLHVFAPLLVDGKWLAYRKPPAVKLREPFVV